MRSFYACLLFILLSSFATLAWPHGDSHKHENHVTKSTNEKSKHRRANELERRKLLEEIGDQYTALAEPIFKVKCFDCHSSKTKYPWYYKLPKVKALIDDDVAEGKKHLDLTDGFPFRGHGTPEEDLAAIREAIKTDTMPPPRYRWLHWGSQISKTEKETIFSWIDRSVKTLQSLEKKDGDARK